MMEPAFLLTDICFTRKILAELIKSVARDFFPFVTIHWKTVNWRVKVIRKSLISAILAVSGKLSELL